MHEKRDRYNAPRQRGIDLYTQRMKNAIDIMHRDREASMCTDIRRPRTGSREHENCGSRTRNGMELQALTWPKKKEVQRYSLKPWYFDSGIIFATRPARCRRSCCVESSVETFILKLRWEKKLPRWITYHWYGEHL